MTRPLKKVSVVYSTELNLWFMTCDLLRLEHSADADSSGLTVVGFRPLPNELALGTKPSKMHA